MTTAIFLILFFAFLVAVLNWLPDAGSLSDNFINSYSSIIGTMKAWNFILPINELLICVGFVIAYEILMWSWFKVLGPITRIIRGGTH